MPSSHSISQSIILYFGEYVSLCEAMHSEVVDGYELISHMHLSALVCYTTLLHLQTIITHSKCMVDAALQNQRVTYTVDHNLPIDVINMESKSLGTQCSRTGRQCDLQALMRSNV